MALSPFLDRQLGVFDPFLSPEKRMWDAALSFWDRDADGHSRQFARDVSAVANTRIDWCETPHAHVLKADLPGLDRSEVKIQLEEDRVLQISGERKREESRKTDNWHRVERAHGSFLRRFWLPDDSNVDAISAKVDHGVLTVTVPKLACAAEKNNNVKPIDVQ
ncbi:17.6 kDa class I heat shock protein-like [Selaginella moellendorffii]|uniref:17.6 kDa class I heat shock protein-like n=1 Tax=Selaginella moellendorffii TaxID=88036 RepID=UPI000D1C4A5D|nr:17.6 kDa class I heat shock protein-like [Selaginella moellendorffii]|eukprot:XP_024527571.1 17.6 kDa class I heat shock protein-like [Selaginella moellendorffii]